MCTRFETILYVYNHKTKYNSTKRSSADIFLYAVSPDFNVQQNKIDKIEYLNKNRHEFEVDIKYRQAPLVKSKITNPFKKTGSIEQVDSKHFGETNRGRKIIHYKSKFKKHLIRANTVIPNQPKKRKVRNIFSIFLFLVKCSNIEVA